MTKEVSFITSVFPPTTIGGVERYLMYITRGLKEHGISSNILTGYYPNLPKRKHLPEYSQYRIGLNPFPYTSKRYISGFKLLLDRITFAFFGYFEALNLIQNSNVIHSQLGGRLDLKLGAKLARRTAKAFIVTVHGRFGTQPGDQQEHPQIFENLMTADKVIVNRNITKSYLIEKGIDKVVFLPNPIPVDYYSQPESMQKKHDKVRVLFLGRLNTRRGPQLALPGFLHAIKTNPYLEFWVVGDGPLLKSLVKIAKKSGFSDNVVFFGEKHKIRKFLWNCDIFLAPSPIANSPSLALREAMAAGLAIVATDVEDTRFIVQQNKTGILVPANPFAIGEAILQLATQEKLRESLAKSAKIFAEKNFSLDSYIKSLLEIYEL